MKCLKSISHLKLCNSKWAPLKIQELVCLGEVQPDHDSSESIDIVLAWAALCFLQVYSALWHNIHPHCIAKCWNFTS